MVKFELYNNVGDSDGITVDKVRSFLNANKNEDIQFDISTLGGDLATAITIHDLIKTHPEKTVANIVGLTASAGTVIAIACDEVLMSDNALFLIHNGWQELTGNVYDFQQAASNLMKTDAIMIKMYREKTGLQDDKIKSIMRASDWLSPYEAKELGFVDRVTESGVKIAANIIMAQAKTKINNQLLIKLEEKMKLNPFKKEDKQIFNILALKDEKNLLINAEAAVVGAEVAPIGAMTLEDGEYELADGRKIMVAGGVITEVVEETTTEPAAETEAIVAAVAEVVTAQIAAVKAEMQAEFRAELAKISSSHKPAKGAGPVAPAAQVKSPDVISRVNAVADGIRQKIVESRKS